jgi:NAD(P)-dependent dehydrogenase (short-subunit alcohol dehydrogenase family)
MDRFVGKAVLVTGAASGSGAATAARLVGEGAAVLGCDINEPAAPDLGSNGGTFPPMVTDVRDDAAVAAAVAAASALTGRLDGVVNAAGVAGGSPVHLLAEEEWDRIIAVNLTGTFVYVQAAVPDMQAAGWGRIVTISSSSAQSGARNMAHYAASKGGVISLTKALAGELARRGITVNTIPPSLVDTPMVRNATAAGDFPGVEVVAPMVPVGRAGTPADIAAACSFLCSESAGYITGQVIGVNGGMYI